MKKFGLGKRIIALVLVLLSVMAILPMDVLANEVVKDYIITGANRGDTGIKESSLGVESTINWPVKVYDFLSDGMLFEFAQYGGTTNLYSKSDVNSNGGGQYVLGQPMPYTTDNYLTDYTVDADYSENAYTYQWNLGRGVRYTRTAKPAVNYVSPRYLRLTQSSSASGNRNFYVSDFENDTSSNGYRPNMRYMVMVYRSSGIPSGYQYSSLDGENIAPMSFLLFTSNWQRLGVANWTNSTTWTYRVFDLYSLGWTSTSYMYTPNLSITPNLNASGSYLDISHVAYFSTNEAATTYGSQCVAFDKEPGEYVSGQTWNSSNNTGFGMLYASNGDAWSTGHGGAAANTTNGIQAGYYTHQIGYRPKYDSAAESYNANRKTGKDATTGRFNGSGNLIGDNGIHYISGNYYSTSSYQADYPGATSYDMANLNFDGYSLLTEATKGGWTAGLLEGSLNKYGQPEYRQETVEYIADMLSKTLTIPQKGTNGYNNYNFVAGVKNRAQYGYSVVNGTEVANDLAQGLRNCLNIYFDGSLRGSTPKMGTYAETLAKADHLRGPFLTVANGGYIKTCMDAAYYLLHNIFEANSYNQLQDDFRYFTLSSATLDSGETAFVFDGGFSAGADVDDIVNGTLTQDQYKAKSQSAVNYSGYNTGGTGTISLGKVDEKDLYYYAGSSWARTTRFPFLPVVDSEGAYAGQTDSYYFAEDGKRNFSKELGTYYDRNYGYTLVSNGEFVYTEENDLFFEFEGDDDVYLFINGQLVLDIGGGHSISNCRFDVNDYVYWARDVLKNPAEHTEAEIKRAEALDLNNGEIATFDFYYMERHGYGANMRIVTNMHITDPALRVEKNAYQGGKQIEYGGIIEPQDPIEYSFKLLNAGNTKLYNLDIKDEDIGVYLNAQDGLLVKGDDTSTDTDDINGYIVTDARGGTLDASDITAVVQGYKNVGTGGDYIKSGREYTKVEAGTGTHVYYDGIDIKFANNDALKSFMHTLEAEGTDNSLVDEEQTQSGSGLWVDASVTFNGIYYTMTHEQEESGVFNNTVYVTGTNRAQLDAAGIETLRSEARHRVYVRAIPNYYQWAGHELFISEQRVLDDATAAAGDANSMLHDYEGFFNAVNGDTSIIHTRFTDRNGNRLDDEDLEYVDYFDASDGTSGFLTRYDKPGIYEFFITMNLDSAGGSNPDLSKLNKDQYAIIRVLIIVTDVEDSSYVLDYGLKTENLDVNGELFKNDELLGAMSGIEAKVMGINSTGGDYLSVKDGTADYNRIDFTPMTLTGSDVLNVNGKDGKQDGYFTFNMNIPDTGKDINYDKYSAMYSLTESGTTTVHARVPYAWEEMFLYYWYDDGSNNVWPGTPMQMSSHGNFSLNIPGNVPHIILSNGTNQTVDIDLTTGQEVWVDIDGETNESGKLKAGVSYRTTDGIIHATVPSDWGDVYLYCWDAFGNAVAEWPGTKIESVDADGYYTYTIPGDITNVIINNGKGMGKQTVDLIVYAGKETWIDVNDTADSYNEGTKTNYYKATSSRSNETVTMHAKVPDNWEAASFYYWNSNGSSTGVEWPGISMTKGADGWYTVEGIPADVTNAIVNDGKKDNAAQTFDYIITPGLETWLTVLDMTTNASVKATVPDDWGQAHFYFFNDSGQAVGDSWPGAAATAIGNNTYTMDVPPYATRIVINNGNGRQTQDYGLFGNQVNEITIDSNNDIVKDSETTLKITVPDNFGDVYVHYWSSNNTASGTGWPGVQVTERDSSGVYTFKLPIGVNQFIVNNNNGWQTGNTWAYFLGEENTVKVVDGTANVSHPKAVQSKHGLDVSYGTDAQKEGYFFTPTDFMDNIYSMYMALTVHENDVVASKLAGKKIDIGNEVQMYKKISVLPANVVYYEDDFAGIKYDKSTENVITHYGTGSGSLTQSVDQSQEYGKDIVYQGSENDEATGGSLTDVNIKNNENVISFEFTGTGFEIIGHTHALESGSAMVTVTGANGFKKMIPVITEFDNSDNDGTDTITSVPIVRVSGLDFGKYTVKIAGVPIYDFTNWDGTTAPPVNTSYLCIDGIRIYQPIDNSDTANESENLALGKDYDAVEEGKYGYSANLTDGVAATALDFEKKGEWFGFNKEINAKGGVGYVTVDLGEEYNLNRFRMHLSIDNTASSVGQPQYVEVAVSSDNESYTFAGNLNVQATASDSYWAELNLATASEGRYVRFYVYNNASGLYWNMLNEVEVYGTEIVEAGKNDAYNSVENGADFSEIRNLIADRKGFAVKYDETNGLSVSGGTNTWIENRNNRLPGDNTKWTNNTVNSINDYLLAGPNNEIYLSESTDDLKSGLAFYVKEDTTDTHGFQIGVRGVDYGAFTGAQSTGLIDAQVQYCAKVEDKLVWKTIANLVSTTEQYFTIPYDQCPYDAENGRYQIVLRVADTDITGMASFTTVKTKGLEFCQLNEAEVPDVIYNDELTNIMVDSNGNSISSSKFVDFINLSGAMVSEYSENLKLSVSNVDTVVNGSSTASMASLYDSFTANESNFALTDDSRFYIVSENNTAPSQAVQNSVSLASTQFAAETTISNWPAELLPTHWGSESYIERGDIVIYQNSSYQFGSGVYDDCYKIEINDGIAKVYARTADGVLYGLNTLQKHFRKSNTNAIKGFTLTDAPDTIERTVHLDIARKYLTKEWVCNYIAEMSWMGYNAIELHLSEDGGFRSDFWDDTYYPKATGNTGNDFSWAVGSMLQPWCYSCPDPDMGKYLTAAELVEICETANRYNIEIIPSFDTPAHVGWLTKRYYDLTQAGNTGIKTFKYGGSTYTLPTRLHYRNNGSAYDYAVLNLGNATVQKFAFAMYTDIAAFFRYYAGSTKFNVCGDEVALTSTDTWNYADFMDYVNTLDGVLNNLGYKTRIYNDFLDRSDYISASSRTPASLNSDIEIVYWDAPNTSGTTKNIKKASHWYNNRAIYSGVQNWTYYVLRLFNTPGSSYTSNAIWGMDARHPNNTWWSFSRNTQSRIYLEWDPTRFSESHDLAGTQTTDEYYSGSNLAGGYFMVWCDYAGLNTEKEMWNGVYDETAFSDTSESPYSLIKRMWSSAVKMWNWDIDDTVSFGSYEVLRDSMGYFPGYGGTENSCSERTALVHDALPTVTGPFLPTYTVKFVNYDGTIIDTQNVLSGSDATAPNVVPTREPYGRYTYTFDGWDREFTNITGNTTIKATYKAEAAIVDTMGYLEVQVVGGTSFTISRNGGTAIPMSTNYAYNDFDAGTEVTLTAISSSNNTFIGWINSLTGEILTTNREYTFYSSGNDVLVALFDTDITDKSTVIFMDKKANAVLDIQAYASGEAITFPADPAYLGYEFAGWDLTEDEIKAKIANGEDVTVNATWAEKETYVALSVKGGSLIKSGGTDETGKYRAYKAVFVEADAAPSGKKFAYWTQGEGDDATIVSYDVVYRFYPVADTVLTAVYVNSSDTVTPDITVNAIIDTESYADKNNILFSWSVPQSKEFTFVNAGLLLVNANDYNENTFVIGTNDINVIQFVPGTKYQTSTGAHSITRTDVATGETMIARAYVQYRDAEGVLRVAYSDNVQATKG